MTPTGSARTQQAGAAVQPANTTESHRVGRWRFGPYALLRIALFATLLVYIQTIAYGFVYDDFPQIELNPWVHSFRYWPEFFGGGVWSFGSVLGNYYRPIFTIWLAGNYALFGSTPGWWHLMSIFAHVAATGCVYLLAFHLLDNRWTAATAALLFGLNPIHVESVAWVSAVPEILTAIFFIAAFLAYDRWRERKQVSWLVLSCVFYALTLLSKETGVAFLPVIGLWAWRRLSGQQHRIRAWFLYISAYVALTFAYLAARAHALGSLANSNYPRPWTWVVMTWPSALWLYLRSMLWPFSPSPAYDLDLVRHFTIEGVILPLFYVLVTLAVIAWVLRRKQVGNLSAVWIFMPLVPVLIGIHVFQWHDYVHDRYTYLPSVFVAIAVACALQQLSELIGKRRFLAFAIGVIAIAFAVSTVLANRYWDSDPILFARAYHCAPHNPLAGSDYAQALYVAGRTEESLALLKSVLRNAPDYWEANYVLGLTYYRMDRYDQAEKYLEAATRLWPQEFFRPDGAQFYYLGLVEERKGNDSGAEAALRQAIELQPYALSYHYELAAVLNRLGHHQEAEQQLRIEAQNRRRYSARQKEFVR